MQTHAAVTEKMTRYIASCTLENRNGDEALLKEINRDHKNLSGEHKTEVLRFLTKQRWSNLAEIIPRKAAVTVGGAAAGFAGSYFSSFITPLKAYKPYIGIFMTVAGGCLAKTMYESQQPTDEKTIALNLKTQAQNKLVSRAISKLAILLGYDADSERNIKLVDRALDSMRTPIATNAATGLRRRHL